MQSESKKLNLLDNETILWKGKPEKRAFVVEKSLAMFPLALVWLLFDLGFITSIFENGEGLFFLIPFFLLHLMPVWIWLFSFLTAGKQYKNTEYFITDQRIVIRHGVVAVNEISLFYKDLRNVQMHVGFWGKIFHVADVRFDAGFQMSERNTTPYVFQKLNNAERVYSYVQQVILDAQSDMEDPSKLRPEKDSVSPMDK